MADLVSTQKRPWSLDFQRLSDVEFKETHWLWYPYIPAGALSLLFGNGGIGKSYLTCAIAADISMGRALPGQDTPMPPQKVLMVSAEDDAGRIIKPRIERLKGNPENIFVSDTSFILDQKGIDGLENAMKQVAATVVFLDPLVSYLGGKMDINKSNETRAMMGPLAQAAANTGCAVVVVHHVRKDAKGKMIHQALGSADFGNSVRSAMLIAESKGGQRFMNHVKHNWSSRGASLAYVIEGDTFRWDGVFMDEETTGVSTTPRTNDLARNFLQDLLRDGPVPAVDVLSLAADKGIAERTLNRSKTGLAVSRKQDGIWVWGLIEREGMGDVVQYDRGSKGDKVVEVTTGPQVATTGLVSIEKLPEQALTVPVEASEVPTPGAITEPVLNSKRSIPIDPAILADARRILEERRRK